MVNEFPIKSFSPAIYWRAVLNCYVKYADVSAGDMAEIWTDKRGYLGTFQIAQVSRSIDNAKIVFDGTKAWDALYGNQVSPVPAENQTGTLKIVQKNTLRPKFPRYYDEYVTPIYSSIYKNVRNLNGKIIIDLPQGINFPANISAEIISSSGKYSGIHLPTKRQQWADIKGVIELHFDIPYNGDDSGVVVYSSTANTSPVNYDKPYIDTTQAVPTVVNPTNQTITVNSTTDSGVQYTQVVPAGETQIIAAPVEKTADPVFVVAPVAPTVQLKTATIPTNQQNSTTMTDSEYKVLIAAEMERIKKDPAFIKLIIDSYKSGPFGYTQTIATNAIKELKGRSIIPINQFGVGLWGQGAWVKVNYPLDEYVPAVPSSQPPVIPVVDPNPGATPTPSGNPGSAVPIPSTTVTPPPVTTATPAPTVTPTITPIASVEEKGWLQNPLVQIVLGVVGVLLIVKIFKTK